jgi:hypothetical protein
VIAPIIIGFSSTMILIVVVCAVNLALRYVRLQPWSEQDALFVRWCLLFAAIVYVLQGAG